MAYAELMQFPEPDSYLEFPSVDKQYAGLIHRILTVGKQKTDPQGVGNISVSGEVLKYDLSKGFPLITLRDLSGSWKAMAGELLWFIRGNTNVNDLHKDGIHMWDIWTEPTKKEFGYPEGELGPIYGKQWRAFDGGGAEPVDQLLEAMRLLRENPDSRRIAVSAWNPYEINKVFISPCVRYFQFHHAEGQLNLCLLQGSGDVPVGIPFDAAEYSLLLLMAAKINNMTPGTLTHFIVDAHIYNDQIPHMRELIQREPLQQPRVEIDSTATSILDFKITDFKLLDYNPHPKMKIPVAL